MSRRFLDPLNALTFRNESIECNKIRIAVKDNIAVKGWPLTCASQFLKNFIAEYDASCIEMLKKSEKYTIVGKTNLDEFAMGSSTNNKMFGRTLNPSDKNYSVGGSSGGSAAAVASDMVDIALGSDTGGSVRLPASYCGIIGFKPSYGSISRHGLVSYAPSMDTIGIIAKDINLTSDLFKIVSQTCHLDIRQSEPTIMPSANPNLKFGKLKDFKLPFMDDLMAIYKITAYCEAASSLARYQKYNVFQIGSAENDLGTEVRKRKFLGQWIKQQHLDKYFQAQRLRKLLAEALYWIFQSVDVLATHTAGRVPQLSEDVEDHWQNINLVLANLTGIPAISLPLHPKENIVQFKGTMLMAAKGNDHLLLQAAKDVLNE